MDITSNKKLTLKKLIISVIAPGSVFALHVFLSRGFIGNYYLKYPWLDIPFHLMGGISIFIFLYYLIYKYQIIGDAFAKFPLIVQFIITTSFVSLSATAWEFLEWTTEYLKYSSQGDLNDTLFDLFLGIMGGAISSIFYLFSMSLKK